MLKFYFKSFQIPLDSCGTRARRLNLELFFNYSLIADFNNRFQSNVFRLRLVSVKNKDRSRDLVFGPVIEVGSKRNSEFRFLVQKIVL